MNVSSEEIIAATCEQVKDCEEDEDAKSSECAVLEDNLVDTFLFDSKFLAFFLSGWPHHLSSLETQKMVVVFFALSTCATLDKLHVCSRAAAGGREALVDWIYAMQIGKSEDKHRSRRLFDADEVDAGFRPSGWALVKRETTNTASNIGGTENESEGEMCSSMMIKQCYDCSHLTMSHVALLSLLCLEDSLDRVDRAALLSHVASLQQPTGCFKCSLFDGEEDVRFTYAAVSICYILDSLSSINLDSVSAYLIKCLSPVGGAFAQKPGGEAHAGCTYLALASFKLMGRLDVLSDKQRQQLLWWLVSRQEHGFNGRPSKDEDTCYFFWVGASLSILGAYDLIDHRSARLFAKSCQGVCGGYCKTVDASNADPLHTHCVISALALDPGLNQVPSTEMLPLNDVLDIPEKYHEHLLRIHKRWNEQANVVEQS